MLARIWMAGARVRRRFDRVRGKTPPRERLIERYVSGRSFADVGCMWGIDGAIAFTAEAGGATKVTGVDVMAPTPTYEATHRQRNSRVRFIQGDLHDPETIAAIGIHDIVWCSGLIYHAPHPLLTLQRLRELTGELLILASETIPEVPGIRQACVFLPGLDEHDRRTYARAHSGEQVGLTTAFDPARGYANWYWGITPSALAAMTKAAGFEPLTRSRRSLHTTLIARPIAMG
jgi:hypothetical protein